MYSKIISGSAMGIDGMIVSVEADICQGLPGLSLVGYLASSVKEAGDRVRAALRNVGYYLPSRKIIINLSPADVRKEGSSYDLAIAVSILISMGTFQLSNQMYEDLQQTLFMGELSLDGSILGVSGVLSVLDYAKSKGYKRFIVPSANAIEASLVKEVDIIPVDSLLDVVAIFLSGNWGKAFNPPIPPHNKNTTEYDLCDIKGQDTMKRGVIIAVAGFHNILMTGAAGSGKSMIAKCIPGIMPPLTYSESMILTKIYSVAGLLPPSSGMINERPFRSPHQNISESVLCGGGASPKPGEVSLANSGVLFLDEFPEFKRSVIESLRQPMEDKKVTVSRVKASYTFPANFMLVSARNNCPCGHYPDRNKCRCTPGEIFRYQSKVSHPIMDRIDIRLEVSPVSYDQLFSNAKGISSSEARNIITSARKRQELRYKNENFIFNSQIPQSKIDQYVKLGQSEKDLLQTIYQKSNLSARGYFRLLRLSRTIADINDRENITSCDIEEAIFYRNEDDKGRELI
ncbi:MAG: YifB family Mg chelatase-like AAA ATPase [Eubacterium sp.]|nr:YifB family Mg chelatase-like AAA ATPase [Eubacterium sp.]